MPELPEVEVVKLFLEQKLLHQVITSLEILNPKSFIGDPQKVINQEIVKFTRLGKQLSIYLSNGQILLIHLKMTGQLVLFSSFSREGSGDNKGQGILMGHPTKNALDELPNKSTRLIFHFSPPSSREVPAGQGVLYFNDQRKFGWIKLLTQSELTKSQENLGLDIFDPSFTPQYLLRQLSKSRRPVKIMLLDQHYFAGIGNIYANDALFLAAINPKTPSNRITLSQAKSIHKYLVKIMKRSVLSGGSTTRDQKYLRPDGTIGQNQFFFQVYERKGEPCLKCGTKIEYLKLGGRGTFFCPHCQCNK